MTKNMEKKYLSTGNNEHPTPKVLFDNIKNTLGIEYDIDLSASSENTKCDKFWSKEQDALKQVWDESFNWCNPPYSKDLQPKFVQKAYESSLEFGNTFVFLIPLRGDTQLWHEYIWGKADIYIFKGRPKFYSDKSPTYASAVVVFSSSEIKNIYTVDKEFNIINKISN